MNLYLFTYFMIFLIRIFYSQICVNFKFIGKNGDNWAKGKYTKLKRESWNTSTLTKVSQICKMTRCHHWISLKRVESRLSEITPITLNLFMFYSPKRTH